MEQLNDPALVIVDGKRWWDFGHKMLPYISGGSDAGGDSGDGNGDGANGTGGGDGGNDDDNGDRASDRTFTQAELDAKVEERLRRERQKYSDYDDLKSKATELDKLKDSQKDATQKAVDDAKRQTREEVTAEMQQERFGDRVLVHAAKDFADPDDAVLRLKDRFKEFIDKDGKVDDDGIKSELKTLLKTKPYLVATDKKKSDDDDNGDVDGGARKPSSDSDVSPGMGRMRDAYANSSKKK